jgi:hypothetical protein
MTRYFNTKSGAVKNPPPQVFIPYLKVKDSLDHTKTWIVIAVGLFATYFSYGVVSVIIGFFSEDWRKWISS